jgi:Uma2 family endonuclease
MFTVYNDDTEKYIQVNEPDASLTYTYADYLKWKFEERLELFRGKIFKLAAPNRKHQELVGAIFYEFATFLKKKQCQVYIAPFDVRLPVQNKKRDDEITTVVQPDLCVICDPSKLDEKGCVGAPDIVVEILSPGNTKKEVQDKFELYEEAGVKEYWVVIPPTENIIIYTLENGRYIGSKPFAPGEIITSLVLPSLTIDVKEIFN